VRSFRPQPPWAGHSRGNNDYKYSFDASIALSHQPARFAAQPQQQELQAQHDMLQALGESVGAHHVDL
jgi:hypothetical protein